jgi:hypothetical protein
MILLPMSSTQSQKIKAECQSRKFPNARRVVILAPKHRQMARVVIRIEGLSIAILRLKKNARSWVATITETILVAHLPSAIAIVRQEMKTASPVQTTFLIVRSSVACVLK